MADHLHKQIRSAVVTKLTGLTTSGSRVHANRLAPLPDALSPSLLVTLDEERASGLTIHQPQAQERELTLSVSAVAKATAALDDTLDLMSKEVEIALAAGITVGSQTLQAFYTGMSFEDVQSDKPVGIKRMTFSIPFTAMSNAPDTLI
ncbi:MAG: hypothetical protein KJ787_13920 [Gammaproteobacteria bacterium]|nr:hypothetical protein [Gammaproteobacteria bacterium]MBU1647424.1 hypothetical protein [Gammaproteobacteria bacterium]MBU1973216.1 hypothetical protein [Gammaproteobacteria bacterium]